MSAILNTILDIYSAPGSSEKWGKSVESISELVGGKASAYILVNKDDLSTRISSIYGYPEYMIKEYEGLNGAAKDVRFKYIDKLLPGKVFREFEYVPDRLEYNSSVWIQYQLKELDIYYSMAALISKHGLWGDYITINRLRSRGPHTDQEKADLQNLLPHLSKAAELHLLVTNLEKKYSAVLSVLDKYLVGLVLLDEKNRIVIANKAAKAIRDESGSFIFSSNGYLKVAQEILDIKFKSILSLTNATLTQGGSYDGGQLVLNNNSNGGKLLFEIVPIKDDGFSDSDNIQGTAVFIMDPGRSQFLSSEGLSNIFGLTESETDITSSLINGFSINDISDLRCTKPETVRGQLKVVFSKTGAKSQLDLIRLAVKANPPIE